MRLPKLVAQRKALVDGLLPLLEEADDEALRRFLVGLDARDAEGKFTPFASAAVQVLSAYVPP